MKVKTGTPCLLMEEIVYDQYDKPFHRTKSVLRGDKFKYISPRMNVVKACEQLIKQKPEALNVVSGSFRIRGGCNEIREKVKN